MIFFLAECNYLVGELFDSTYFFRYFSGPNNGVVLNKHGLDILFAFCTGKNICLWKNFKSDWVKKRTWVGYFFSEYIGV